MIRLEHVVLPSPEQMEFVIEGMRNPMNSWDKSDSFCIDDCLECQDRMRCPREMGSMGGKSYRGGNYIGPNDLDLMQRLSKAGTDHRKFMRMMPVMVRITAPLYWWKEFDTYKVGTVANSCSTMHKIHAKEFELSDFSFNSSDEEAKGYYLAIIGALNNQRDLYNENMAKGWDLCAKNYWYNMIQLLPNAYNQTRNVMLNYEVLANIVKSRQSHKLYEWVEFCKWAVELPYAKELFL